jgi:hypothetical protein
MLGSSLVDLLEEFEGEKIYIQILTPFPFLLLFFASFIFSQKMSKIHTFFKFFLDSSHENTKYLARFYIILPHSPPFTNHTVMALL